MHTLLPHLPVILNGNTLSAREKQEIVSFFTKVLLSHLPFGGIRRCVGFQSLDPRCGRIRPKECNIFCNLSDLWLQSLYRGFAENVEIPARR